MPLDELINGLNAAKKRLTRLFRDAVTPYNTPLPTLQQKAKSTIYRAHFEPQTSQPIEIGEQVRLLTKEFHSLEDRISQEPEQTSGFSFFSASKGFPSVDELFQFIEKVKFIKEQYPKTTDNNIAFSDLMSAVGQLATAMEIHDRLILSHAQLIESPFEQLDKVKLTFSELASKFHQYKAYFSDHCDKEHPLNLKSVNHVLQSLRDDKSLLEQLYNQFILKIKQKLDSAASETDLPTIEEHNAISLIVDKNFSASLCYRSITAYLTRLKDERQTILDNKLEYARQRLQYFTKTLDAWRQHYQLLKQDVTSMRYSRFPWRSMPPSFADIAALQQELDTAKEMLAGWPSALAEMGEFNIDLEYDAPLFKQAIQVCDIKIKKAFREKKLSHREVENYILCYSRLLTKVEDEEKEQKISRCYRQLFLYVHQQYKASQWVGFLRYSFWDNKDASELTWRNIVALSLGHHDGYKGERTIEALRLLRWIDQDNNPTANAPMGFRREAQEQLQASL